MAVVVGDDDACAADNDEVVPVTDNSVVAVEETKEWTTTTVGVGDDVDWLASEKEGEAEDKSSKDRSSSGSSLRVEEEVEE